MNGDDFTPLITTSTGTSSDMCIDIYVLQRNKNSIFATIRRYNEKNRNKSLMYNPNVASLNVP